MRREVRRHQQLPAEHHVHGGSGGLGELAVAQQDGLGRSRVHDSWRSSTFAQQSGD